MAQTWLGSASSNSTRTTNLVDLCCVALAKCVAQNKSRIGDGLRSLPSELSERLLSSLTAQNLLTSETLMVVATSNPKKLCLGGLKQKPDRESLLTTLSLCSSLEVLNLSASSIDDSVLQLLCQMSYSSQLRIVDLSTCVRITSKMVQQFLFRCEKLEQLDLSGCNITDETFSLPITVPTKFCHLPEIGPMKKRAREGENESVGHFKGSEFVSFGITKRRKVNWKKEDFVHKCNESDPLYNPRLVNLHSLNISGCCSLTNRGLEFISHLFPYLVQLNCSHLEIKGVLDIGPILSNCKFLKSLNINGCILDQSKIVVEPSTPKLEEINFCGTGTISCHFSTLLEHCAPVLRVLRIRNKSFTEYESQATPLEWLKSCRVMSILDLYSVSVDDCLISHLLNGCRNTLKVLDITHCPISDENLNLLSNTQLPNLSHLSLNQMAIVQWLPELGGNCPNLRHLCLNLCLKTLLLESRLTIMLSRLSLLKNLELWSLESISLPSIVSVLQLCPQLRSLLLSTVNQEPQEMVRDEGESNESEEDSLMSDSLGKNHKGGLILSSAEFSLLTQTYPHVQFKIWYHTIYGNRSFRYHMGSTQDEKLKGLLTPTKINQLGVKLRVEKKEKGIEIIPTILVDNIPIWSQEMCASLSHLRLTTETNGGAVPLISEWCCECDVESYNGVLFYHDTDYVFWETHEPGVPRKFCFSKSQYFGVINNARLQFLRLVWQQQKLLKPVPCTLQFPLPIVRPPLSASFY
eukprot:TRINITY_DN11457_c0_g1_i19.p1 TRINITY_DN11457_c0_g1~~TRINITY_DN11457_c0_g1_i19.p1  ORF type:complete len:748 (-),score=96.65 TRINITY_DN11457_c0_g1_i19:586-2829(-)